MNLDKDKIFENKLRQVDPTPVDDLLTERIARRIRETEAENRSSRWLAYIGWGGLVAAATVMVAVGFTLFTANHDAPDEAALVNTGMDATEAPEATSDDDTFKPVIAQNNLKERIDEGIVFLDGGLTARKYRYQFIDRVVWRNPKNGARVEMEVPRDEVVLIPVQTY